jgi:hypothetical protein
MNDNHEILNPNKFKDNQESLGKNPLKIKLRKSKQKEVKRKKQGDWCPCSQGDRDSVREMELYRRLWRRSIQLMSPSSRPMGSASEVSGALL